MTAQPPPSARSVEQLKEAAATCTGCDLYQEATQTVFGEGAEPGRMMLIGEQPGDQEDLQGKPFVGPAGRVLAQALEAARIDRRRIYVTNAVKHFRFKRRGKRRLHEKPNAAQVRACRPWLEAEIQIVRPRLLVLLGATAAQSVMGPAFRVSKQRGEVLESPFGIPVVATVHPSSIRRRLAGRRHGGVHLRPDGCGKARIRPKCRLHGTGAGAGCSATVRSERVSRALQGDPARVALQR